MKKKHFPGVTEIDDDNEIQMMLESEGIFKKWEALKDRFKDMARVMAYDTKGGERWVIWECIGIPGDEGLMMLVIKKNMLNHPLVRRTLLAVETLMELDIKTAINIPHQSPDPNRN